MLVAHTRLLEISCRGSFYFQLLLSEKAEAMMEEVEQLVSVPEGIAISTVAMTTTATPALVTPDMSQNSTASQEILKPV